jgi:TM2 domain-containing membrane protein YozV
VEAKKTAVFVLNLIGLNCISRFITGHIGTGIIVLLLDIISLITLAFIIGGIGFSIAFVIWIVDLVTVCTNKWRTGDGKYLTEW